MMSVGLKIIFITSYKLQKYHFVPTIPYPIIIKDIFCFPKLPYFP